MFARAVIFSIHGDIPEERNFKLAFNKCKAKIFSNAGYLQYRLFIFPKSQYKYGQHPSALQLGPSSTLQPSDK